MPPYSKAAKLNSMNSWPHSPAHYRKGAGMFMVTAATYRKERLFRDPERLDLLQRSLIELAAEFGWVLNAWAVFSNHYHFVGQTPESGANLRQMTNKLHSSTARIVNRLDEAAGRRVWFQYWESELTFERSILARIAYVNGNPVHHGLTASPELYPWCSARWFAESAEPAFRKTVLGFKTDRVRVPDDF